MGGAAGIAFGLADAGTGALGGEFAVVTGAGASANGDADGVAFVAGLVLQVAEGEAAVRLEAVLVVGDGFVGAGDDGALEVGVAAYLDLEAVVNNRGQTTIYFNRSPCVESLASSFLTGLPAFARTTRRPNASAISA